MPIAHSYSRFSHQNQAAGDSFRRQIQATKDCCKRNGWTLSNQRYHDAGKSGFKGDQQKQLGRLLDFIRDGKIAAGDILIVENIDRLSRKGIRATQGLFNEILDAGIEVVILSPTEMKFTASDSDDISQAIILATMAYQANQYSLNLSQRVKAANSKKRKDWVDGKAVKISAILPAWIEETGPGKLKVKKDAAKVIRYIFKRTVDGVGRKTLVRELNGKFKPIASRRNTTGWNEQYLKNLITTRRVLGDAVSTVTGEEFEGIYPPVIDQRTWKAANAAAKRRTTQRGPSVNRVNLFAGALFHAKDRCPMHFTSYSQSRADGTRKQYHRYRSKNHVNGLKNASSATVDVTTFEHLVFEFLPEMKLGKRKRDRFKEKMDELAAVKNQIREIENQLVDCKSDPVIFTRIFERLHNEENDLKEELSKCPESRQSTPTETSRKRLSKMARGTEEERYLVRERVLDLVERIDVLPVKMGKTRCARVRCLVELAFKTGQRVRAVEIDDNRLIQIKCPESLIHQICTGFKFGPKQFRELRVLLSDS